MTSEQTQGLLKRLIELMEAVSKGEYEGQDEIFELTKTGQYPPLIVRTAESFAMMMVGVEAREMNLSNLIDELKKTQAELSKSRDQLNKENLNLRQSLREKFSPNRILGSSRQIQELLGQVERLADTPVNVLITGETGTGKELVAKALHFNSGRAEKPFIPVSCSAIPETLFESELFGIERGVATGVEKRIGKVEQANGGTLLLDEIGDMPLSTQAKLLRVVEEREVERVGGRVAIPVDVRFIAATNKDLKKDIRQGRFREDLYYRINVVNLHLPPLRERKGDIPLLLRTFLELYRVRLGRGKMRVLPEVERILSVYPWPGNVRELENEAERLVALSHSDTVTPASLSEEIRAFGGIVYNAEPGDLTTTDADTREKMRVTDILRQTSGNRSEAARRLGMSREGFRKKMKRLGIQA